MAQYAKPRNRSSLRYRPERGTSTQTRMKRTSLPGRRRRRNGSGGLRRCSSYANRIACRQGFRGIIDNPVGGRQARNDLHTVTEIAAQSHVLEDDLVVAVEGGDLCSLIPSYQRSRRNWYQIRVSRHFELHIALAPAEELAGCIVSLKLDLHAM